MSDGIGELLQETRRVIVEAVGSHPQGALFDDLVEHLSQESGGGSPAPIASPVVERWLGTSVAATTGPWATLAALLKAAASELPWLTAYENLETSPDLEAFRSFYSYQLLAGPVFRGYRPAVRMDEVLVGFTLQAPNIFYPQHHHEPPEIYGVISGSLEWQVGDAWTSVGPGDVIVHRSHESHAMCTRDEPALTWVAWSRNPHASVYMPSMDPPTNTMAPRNYS